MYRNNNQISVRCDESFESRLRKSYFRQQQIILSIDSVLKSGMEEIIKSKKHDVNRNLTFFCLIKIIGLGTCFKGLVQINPCFTHPKGMLSVNNFLLSDDNRSYIKNSPGSFKLYNNIGECFCSTVQK